MPQGPVDWVDDSPISDLPLESLYQTARVIHFMNILERRCQFLFPAVRIKTCNAAVTTLTGVLEIVSVIWYVPDILLCLRKVCANVACSSSCLLVFRLPPIFRIEVEPGVLVVASRALP